MQSYSFTSESVCAGHPDKVCDQISDAIVDAVLAQDSRGRVAVESIATYGRLILAGEISAHAKVDFEAIARGEIRRLGYTKPEWNFCDTSPIDVYIHAQSPEIAAGVDVEGAGDQGMMFGYACQDTPELMPLPIVLAHRLTETVDTARETGTLPYLRPDGKAQVTVAYLNNQPVKVTNVVIAVPHDEDHTLEEVSHDVYTQIVSKVLAAYSFEIKPNQLIVNGTGIWHTPGPAVDTGLTGRKIVVDTYGGYARVGGGAFSGKDPSKVDRSGAYAARFIAKNIVAAGLASRAEVGLAYFIGAKRPLMEEIDTFGTNTVSQKQLYDFSRQLIDTSVAGILKTLDLTRPIYHQTAAYGHFGRPRLPWEEVKTKVATSRGLEHV